MSQVDNDYILKYRNICYKPPKVEEDEFKFSAGISVVCYNLLINFVSILTNKQIGKGTISFDSDVVEMTLEDYLKENKADKKIIESILSNIWDGVNYIRTICKLF